MTLGNVTLIFTLVLHRLVRVEIDGTPTRKVPFLVGRDSSPPSSVSVTREGETRRGVTGRVWRPTSVYSPNPSISYHTDAEKSFPTNLRIDVEGDVKTVFYETDNGLVRIAIEVSLPQWILSGIPASPRHISSGRPDQEMEPGLINGPEGL